MTHWIRKASLVQWLIGLTALQLASGLVFWILWLSGGQESWIRFFFDYQSSLFFLGFTGLDLLLCLRVWRQFNQRETQFITWLILSMAAGCRLLGFFFHQILGKRFPWNPLSPWLTPDSAQGITEEYQKLGLLIGGPINMIFLGIGLFLILRTYQRYTSIKRFQRVDYFILAMVGLFALQQLHEMLHLLRQNGIAYSHASMLKWGTDPWLCVLLFEAILIYRVSSNMGWGLISRCWGAYTMAIFITSIGDMGLWATNYGYLNWPMSSITWFIWFPVYGAYASAPAFQLQALRQVQLACRHIENGSYQGISAAESALPVKAGK